MQYSANDLIMDITEVYGVPSDILRDLYRKEFAKYKPKTLLQIKEAIIERHKYKDPPKLAYVFEYMEKNKISRKRLIERSWMHCATCGTDYPIKTSLCPSCARNKELYKSEAGVKFGLEYPEGMKWVNRNCPVCDKFVNSEGVPKGSMCDAWGTFNVTMKSDKNCNACRCYDCCNEVPAKKGDKFVESETSFKPYIQKYN